MLYRILTEDKNRDDIGKLVSRYFPAFSLFTGQGFWKGTPEHSLCIEIDTDDDSKKYGAVRHIAETIKIKNHQDAVMIQKIETAQDWV